MHESAAPPHEDLVHYVELGAGAPLVLVHGLMVSGAMFESVADHFAERHRVVIPDLRGHGTSRAMSPPYGAATLAADLARLLDRLGIRRAAVLGYSQGGAIAQQFALDFPDRCARLVLAATYAFNMSSARERLEGHAAPWLMRLLGMRRFARLVAAAGARELAPPARHRLESWIADQDLRLMVCAWKASMAFDSRPRLGEIRCPTLIVAGSRDRAVPLHHARMLHRGVAGSRLALVEGAGHAMIWSHAAAVTAPIDAFLDDGAVGGV